MKELEKLKKIKNTNETNFSQKKMIIQKIQMKIWMKKIKNWLINLVNLII